MPAQNLNKNTEISASNSASWTEPRFLGLAGCFAFYNNMNPQVHGRGFCEDHELEGKRKWGTEMTRYVL